MLISYYTHKFDIESAKMKESKKMFKTIKLFAFSYKDAVTVNDINTSEYPNENTVLSYWLDKTIIFKN
ncbi:hypothetical protein BscR1v2_002030 [Bartonella schoenbuchensis R1]|uniref:Uncharacterized protein n=1 Tax=Bartonella schoenbuchensis (strain DSM 13525 / NCTC 13165 / R1) TaxID=687861 RepID=E6YXY5_BARSR|nr:hypothetical protein BscR1v2_002030 [Bartonella schoenbuchensis R1]CBI81723.1 hypothetical protein B11C_10197 [Bartonella schoenbuchensis R1]